MRIPRPSQGPTGMATRQLVGGQELVLLVARTGHLLGLLCRARQTIPPTSLITLLAFLHAIEKLTLLSLEFLIGYDARVA